MIRYLLCSLLLVISPSLLGSTPAQTGTDISLGPVLLQVFFALAFIIGLILGSAWLAKKFKLGGVGQTEQIKALAVLPLGRKEKVVLIESCGKKILIGVGAQSVSNLHVFEDYDGAGIHHGNSSSVTPYTDNAGEYATSQNEIENRRQASSTSMEFSEFLRTVMNGLKPVGKNEK